MTSAREIWHKLLFQPKNKIVSKLMINPTYTFITNTEPDLKECTAFVQAKNKKSLANRRLIEIGKNVTVHVNICKTMTAQTIGWRGYSLKMTTAQLRFTRVEILRNSREAIEHIFDFIVRLDRNPKDPVSISDADNAKTFLVMKNQLTRMDIDLTTFSAYIPEYNDLAERKTTCF